MDNNIQKIMFSKYTSWIFIIIIISLFIFYYLKKIKCPKKKEIHRKKKEIIPQEENLLHVYFRGLPENNQIKYIYKIDSEEGGYKPYNINKLDDLNMTANQVNYTKYESYRKKYTKREDL